jgi:hypothetical protein
MEEVSSLNLHNVLCITLCDYHGIAKKDGYLVTSLALLISPDFLRICDGIAHRGQQSSFLVSNSLYFVFV